MRYWLMKSEPDDVSIDHLARMPKQTGGLVRRSKLSGTGTSCAIRCRSAIFAFFYHSSCAEPGIAGIVKVTKAAYPDKTQFDKKSPYYDPKATPDAPRWVNVEVTLVEKTRLISLAELRSRPELASMRVLARGNRLSITPVDPREWTFITKKMLKV